MTYIWPHQVVSSEHVEASQKAQGCLHGRRRDMGWRADLPGLQGAEETGLAEGYMCSRIMRDPSARRSAAQYLGNFVADESDGGFTQGTQWLVWKFESDSTLATATSVRPPSLLPSSASPLSPNLSHPHGHTC